MKEVVIELLSCVCVATVFITMYGSSCRGRATLWMRGQEHEGHAVAYYLRASRGHNQGDFLLFMVVSSQFFL